MSVVPLSSFLIKFFRFKNTKQKKQCLYCRDVIRFFGNAMCPGSVCARPQTILTAISQLFHTSTRGGEVTPKINGN